MTDQLLLLPDEIEMALTEAVLTEKCSQDFALEFRELCLRYWNDILRKNLRTGECPHCHGFGIIEKDNVQEGCDLCAGAGNIKVVPGPPRSPSHGTMSRTLKRRPISSTK